MSYAINQQDGIDTLHRDPLPECRADHKPDVDPETALRLIQGGYIRRCRRCFIPTEDGENNGPELRHLERSS